MIKNLNRKAMLKDLLSDDEYTLKYSVNSPAQNAYLMKNIDRYKRELALLEEKST
tara:strand:- start:609 stop:773 length:165 start_codon:yes stop_codon:yes gene_type:complete